MRTLPDTPLGELARARARAGGHRPFVTFHDPETGERTELGHATFENWAAKTANLLAEDLALPAGTTVALRVGGHWAGAVVAVAAWRAGLVVDVSGAADDAAVAIVREDLEAPEADELLVVGRGLGARLTGGADAGEPFADEVLAQGDEFSDPPVALDDPALRCGRDVSHRTLAAAGGALAARLGLGAGDRLLCTWPVDVPEGAVALAAALVADAGLVLVPGAGADSARALGTAERATHALLADADDPPPAIP